MRWISVALVLVASACARAGSTSPPGEVAVPSPRALASDEAPRTASEPAAPMERTSQPGVPRASPAPRPQAAPSDDYVRALESLGDGLLTAEVRLDSEGGAVPILVELEREGAATVRLTLGGRRESCAVVDVSLDAVAGLPSPLLLLQRFCENGEDEFSREIDAFVLAAGDDAAGVRVLWEGSGSFRSSFGLCDQIDVPEAEIVRPGVLRVRRWTEVISRPNPRRLGGGTCAPLPAARRTIFETTF